MNAQDKTIAEFFAGIGLMRIGLENAGWRIAFANDIDHDKWEMYKDHFGDTPHRRYTQAFGWQRNPGHLGTRLTTQ
jgi:site-specific DNA-cytosine methylase